MWFRNEVVVFHRKLRLGSFFPTSNCDRPISSPMWPLQGSPRLISSPLPLLLAPSSLSQCPTTHFEAPLFFQHTLQSHLIPSTPLSPSLSIDHRSPGQTVEWSSGGLTGKTTSDTYSSVQSVCALVFLQTELLVMMIGITMTVFPPNLHYFDCWQWS